MHNIIIIEKYDQKCLFWEYLIKNNVLEMSVENVLQKYQGFEGDLISFSPFNKNHLESSECLEVNNSINSQILHVISGESVMPDYLKANFSCVGYDVGICEEEKTIYSSIFNEILFGNLSELILFKNFLNKSFLFPDRLIAQNYVSLHNELSSQKKGVEDYEDMIVYEIWKNIF